MATILSMKDRIKLTIGEVEFTLKPLNKMELLEVTSHKTMESGVQVEDLLRSAFAYIKFALKGISGVKMHNGEDYELEFEGDYLTDDCVSEIFSLNMGEGFIHVIQRLKHNEIQEKPTYFRTKREIEGVKLEIIPSGGTVK